MSCQWLTVPEAAAVIGRTKKTIYRWIKENRIKEVMELPNGRIVVCKSELVRPRRRRVVRPRKKMHINSDLL